MVASIRTIRRLAPHGRGFTLTEVLIAVAIFGVGLTMAAALFPAAIKESERSFSSQIGAIVAQNGLSTAKAVLKPNDIAGPALAVLSDEDIGNPKIAPSVLRYAEDANMGTVVLGRKLADNDFQLVSVSYKKTGGGKAKCVDYTASEEAQFIVVDGVWHFQIDLNNSPGKPRLMKDMPIIRADTGEFVRIRTVEISGTVYKGVVDYALDAQDQVGKTYWTVVSDADADVCPALSVMTTRTSLKQ